jgi:putative membrane protein
MTLVTDQECRAIAARIADVERHTNAELVTVLAARSDDYADITLLWAALIALCVPTLLLLVAFVGPPVGLTLLVGAQLATFCAAAALLRIPALERRIVPRSIRHGRAAALARRQFLEQGLHHTADGTGVLLFVSEAERYVEIIADHGIHARVPNARWDEIVDEFVQAVRAGATLQGFDRALERCGAILADAVPKTPDNRNELDDRLILIGYHAPRA